MAFLGSKNSSICDCTVYVRDMLYVLPAPYTHYLFGDLAPICWHTKCSLHNVVGNTNCTTGWAGRHTRRFCVFVEVGHNVKSSWTAAQIFSILMQLGPKGSLYHHLNCPHHYPYLKYHTGHFIGTPNCINGSMWCWKHTVCISDSWHIDILNQCRACSSIPLAKLYQ